MGKHAIKLIAALLIVLLISGGASAADYESGWSRTPDPITMEALQFLRQKAMQLCGSGDSEYEKAEKLNRYVCDKVDYDYTHTSGGLAGFLSQSNVMCTGYAETLAFLLDCVNIKNLTVTGYVTGGGAAKGLHMWNVVCLDGAWLHIDSTWNDATRCARHPDGSYFLIPADEMGAERQIPLQTDQDYESLYGFLRTVTVSFRIGDCALSINGVRQASTQPGSPECPGSVCSVYDGRTFAPLRELACALGCCVRQEGESMLLTLGTKTLQITPGSDVGYLDGEKVLFGAAPELVRDIIMIPVRPVFEALGAAVDYDADASEVTIFYDPHAAVS